MLVFLQKETTHMKLVIEYFWVTFLAETSKDLEIILITIVLSFTNSLSHTSLKAKIKASALKTIRKTQYNSYEN